MYIFTQIDHEISILAKIGNMQYILPRLTITIIRSPVRYSTLETNIRIDKWRMHLDRNFHVSPRLYYYAKLKHSTSHS